MSNNQLSAEVQAAAWNPNDKERDAITYAAIIIDSLSKVIHGLSTGACYDGIELNMESAKSFFSKLTKCLGVKESPIAGATAEAKKAQAELNEANRLLGLFMKLGDCSLVRDSIETFKRNQSLQQWKEGKEVENG